MVAAGAGKIKAAVNFLGQAAGAKAPSGGKKCRRNLSVYVTLGGKCARSSAG